MEGDFITYCNGNMRVIIAFAIMSIERNGPIVLGTLSHSESPEMATRNAEAARQAVRVQVTWASGSAYASPVQYLPRYMLRHRIGGCLDVLLCGAKEDITELYAFLGYLWQYSSLQQHGPGFDGHVHSHCDSQLKLTCDLESGSANSVLVPSSASMYFSSFSFSLLLSLLLSLSFIVPTPVAVTMTPLFPTSVPFVSSTTSWTKLSTYRYQILRFTKMPVGGPGARVPEALTPTLVPPHINFH